MTIHNLPRFVLRIPALLSLAVLAMSCSPIAPIRSSRIDSNLSMHTGYTLYSNSEHRIKWGIREEKYPADPEPTFNFLNNTGFNFSFKKRAEVSMLFFSILQSTLLSFEVKVPVASFGKPILFRNLGIAPYSGFTYYSGEWSGNGGAWFGTSLGTFTNIFEGDLELILQPAVSFSTDFYRPSEFLISDTGSSDEWGIGEASFDRSSVDISLGTIYRPFPNKRVAFSMGMTYKHYYNNLFSATNPAIKFRGAENDPVIWNLNLIWSIVK